ncbi:hypothetical protein ACA910_014916 [Epithemia clementina (nom. ined.)]
MVVSLNSCYYATIVSLIVAAMTSFTNRHVHFCFCEARLEAALVLPHGDFAFDPYLVSPWASSSASVKAAHDIAHASRQAGQWLQEQVRPDVIFLSTPHGISLETDFGIYLGNFATATTADNTVTAKASGSAHLGQDPYYNDIIDTVRPTPYKVRIDPPITIHQMLSQSLLQHLTSNNGKNNTSSTANGRNNVTGLYLSPDESIPIPLFWAEVIPLLLMPQQQQRQEQDQQHQWSNQRRRGTSSDSSTNTNTNSPDLIIWSHPHRRYTHATDMVEELLRLGASIAEWMNQPPAPAPSQEQQQPKDLRWAVVISGDLAHVHDARGPYGYAPEAAYLDHALGLWGHGPFPCSRDNGQALLESARALQPKGMSCGFTGMVLLQGMLCGRYGGDNSVDNSLRFDDNSNKQNDLSETISLDEPPNNSNGWSGIRTNRTRSRFTARQTKLKLSNSSTMQSETLPTGHKDSSSSSALWRSSVLVNRNVTYYGMMVAKFWLQEHEEGEP